MDVAIIGAGGVCGRQVAMQLIEARVLPVSARLQLVGHRGGESEHELWGLRADLQDAFADWAPRIELAFSPAEVDAEIVVMMAGATVSLNPGAPLDRLALGRMNAEMFAEYAEALAKLPEPPMVIVQSNPVELGVHIFAQHLPVERVLGAAGWSDTLRFRHELAVEFGVPRTRVSAMVLGQHGDHLVPIWSSIQVQGIAAEDVEAGVERIRRDRHLRDLPQEVPAERAAMINLISQGRFHDAYERVKALPVDLRVAVKPFFTAFTSGRTTEIVTAHAAVDVIAAIVNGTSMSIPAQVVSGGVWNDLAAPVAVPVLLGVQGWQQVVQLGLAEDELAALGVADAAVTASIRAALG